MKKSLTIVGIIIGVGIVVLGILSTRLWNCPKSIGVALSAAGGAIFGVSAAMQIFSKMKNDKIFLREINDERNILIKYRSGYIINSITLILIAAATVLFIGLEYYISACITGSIFIINTILLLIVPSGVGRSL